MTMTETRTGLPMPLPLQSIVGKPNNDKHDIDSSFPLHSSNTLVAPINSWNPDTYTIALPSSQHFEHVDKTKGQHIHHSTTHHLEKPSMHRNGVHPTISLKNAAPFSVTAGNAQPTIASNPVNPPVLEWDWDVEHADRKLEAKADAVLHGTTPFQVDRRLLKDVVREKMNQEVVRIKFLSAGTFHKAYLITLADAVEVVARVARRFMPRLKTESEVATMHYLREHTNVPVPTVYHYDSNPYNRLGGEFILMSKAPGIPLSQVFHSLGHNELVKLLQNMASILLPLFSHRFSGIGSLYLGTDPRLVSSSSPTPKATQVPYAAFPFSPTLGMSSITATVASKLQDHMSDTKQKVHVGPIISWPFFGSNRGELTHPKEINRGPWPTTSAYLASCAQREITGVILENEGKVAPHRLHLDPDEIQSSRHHHLKAVPGDESDESDEWDLEESEEEWEGPGDGMYRDYRRMQRSTFLIAHLSRREEAVRKEMERWSSLMGRLLQATLKDAAPEAFGLDCHDLSLENVFVDATDHSKITCIIDWESTTTRPLWQCAHLPAFLQSSPFTANLFRNIVAKMASPSGSSIPTPTRHATTTNIAATSGTSAVNTTITNGSSNGSGSAAKDIDISALAREWLYYEAAGTRLRMAHRFVEWDGWEEDLIDCILGTEEQEEEWFVDVGTTTTRGGGVGGVGVGGSGAREARATPPESRGSGRGTGRGGGGTQVTSLAMRKPLGKLPFVSKEKEKEQMLTSNGDICGGRGGELGRRLEAWLTTTASTTTTMADGHVNGNGVGHAFGAGEEVVELEAVR